MEFLPTLLPSNPSVLHTLLPPLPMEYLPLPTQLLQLLMDLLHPHMVFLQRLTALLPHLTGPQALLTPTTPFPIQVPGTTGVTTNED